MTDHDDRDEAAAREREMQRIDTLEAEIEQTNADRERARAERDQLARTLEERRRHPVPAPAPDALALRPMTPFEIDRLVDDLRTATNWLNLGPLLSYPLISIAVVAIVSQLVSNGLVLFAVVAPVLLAAVHFTRVRARRWQPVLDVVRHTPGQLHSLDYTRARGSYAEELTIRYDDEVVVLRGRGFESLYQRLERRRHEALDSTDGVSRRP